MVAERKDGTGAEHIASFAKLHLPQKDLSAPEKQSEIRYDYVELPIAQLSQLSENEFLQVQKQLEEAGIPCEACNNFFPTDLRLTGPDADQAKALVYAEKALQRAAKLGAKAVVFGSGPAKMVPMGFSLEAGYQQIVSLLKEVNKIARENEIEIVIEPLRKAECNLINTFEEGCKLAKDVAGSNVAVLVDFYHFTVEKEPIEHLLRYGKQYLRHVHFANPNGRVFPASITEAAYRPFIGALHEIGYNGRVSCEAYSKNFLPDAEAALRFFHQAF